MASFSDALYIQNDLDNLCGWAREWLLHFNIVKCKHLKYGTNASPLVLLAIRAQTVVLCSQ